jgi:hypothetical protein
VDILVEIVQKRAGYLDPSDQQKADAGKKMRNPPDFWYRGGVTLIIDPRGGRIRYAIRKSIRTKDDTRLRAVREFVGGRGRALGLRDNYFRANGNPFPFLHATED